MSRKEFFEKVAEFFIERDISIDDLEDGLTKCAQLPAPFGTMSKAVESLAGASGTLLGTLKQLHWLGILALASIGGLGGYILGNLKAQASTPSYKDVMAARDLVETLTYRKALRDLMRPDDEITINELLTSPKDETDKEEPYLG